ncbi:EamA family transporter [Roseobacter sp. HKCCD9010]|uniref:DMT family transporter n=1 Tax=unclassified Roseobacter TaxID=196798 RepID=UPI001492D2D6|nr:MULTISPECIES: DMT family transporter [unclassified Roseobacter]MBF9052281.1 EamA family transporter [Rhodobacterales bacterium HKCCD4356]NNV14199.1 EamA family transporter [Roseobacter sp. HKCCD7357]NNV18441.1 EamA family transporter [Roseobacter sp. HKCCD8768]NNV27862.1 EamA family transporter [Roseobacter sp. HKCCD8192]NNV32128.1 EamA family transporter [Roseobacter sp. HKCCD9061]
MASDPGPIAERRDRIYAVAAVLFGAAMFSLGDAIVKYVSISLGLWQMVVLRALIAIPLLTLLCVLGRKTIPLMPDQVFWTAARSILMVAMWLFYYGALINLSVSEAAAIYYTMPIMLTLLAAVLIGERIHRSGWFAVFLGFLGALITIRPDVDGLDTLTLLPLCSALFFALAMIITRQKLRTEHPLVLTINLQLCFLIAGLLGTVSVGFFDWSDASVQAGFFTNPWKHLSAGEWAVVVLLALIISVGNITTSIAYQKGKASVIGTLSFSYIPFVAIWGFLFFREVPEFSTVIGVIMITVAGSIIVRS